ncbi:MAG TPA: hypothetical protein VGE52_20650 [Pirellulales bacterium]
MRAMLGVMLLSGLWLGSWAAAHRAKERAIARLTELGANVSYEHEWVAPGSWRANASPPGWAWLQRMLGENYAAAVLDVQLYRCTPMSPEKFTDADAALLSSLPTLRTLVLAETQLTDAGLLRLAALPALQELDVENTRVTAQGVENFHAARPSVRVVSAFSD